MKNNLRTRMYTPSKRTFLRQTAAIKRDVAESTRFYRGNLRNSWREAEGVAKLNQYGASREFATKLVYSVANFKVRRKDIFPTLFSAIGFAVPFPGMSVLGFGLGKGVNKFIKAFIFKKF